MKAAIGGGKIDGIQAGLQFVIHEAVGMPHPEPIQRAITHRYNLLALPCEKRELMPCEAPPWGDMPAANTRRLVMHESAGLVRDPLIQWAQFLIRLRRYAPVASFGLSGEDMQCTAR